ncbi:sodium ABC transporter permease [Sulfodiicoccus acidiphilus]|uniref:Sodium ABC transporter permease n=1 Tax=Sulfodiicoccus acidiphilus TaxID=1670455 RepID=A0A348B4E3_9CREN|nr:ABC transporter permease [Sulfodiicoccus acidiphilus]BBD73045.1 sodium ABC transporter permease [Sulfodiicoccus acidiphilus]GGU03865.1 sodium ABC transporter permease [Sulfodiicoccus acidiphilus]
MIRELLRKEILDLKRDRRLLLGSILLPLVMLPLVGGVLLASIVHPPVVEIVNQNPLNQPYVKYVGRYISSSGARVVYNDPNVTPDVTLMFPNSFYRNISEINSTAYLRIYVSVSSGSSALSVVENALLNLSENVTLTRIASLAREAHVDVSPQAIFNPLGILLGYRSPNNHPVSQQQDQLFQFTKVLSLVLFPSALPAVFFIVEGITGERERKTLESLLSTPMRPSSFILTKVATGSLLGVLSSLSEVIGILVFSVALNLYAHTSLNFALPFLGIVVLVYIETVLLTASLSVLVLMLLGGSTRNAQLITTLVFTFILLASFSSLFLNFTALSFPGSLLLIVPYVQLSAALVDFAAGLYVGAGIYVVGTLLISLFLIWFSVRLLDPEKLLFR